MICFCLKVPCRNLLWRIHSRFEVRTWTAMMLCIELRGWMVMMVVATAMMSIIVFFMSVLLLFTIRQ